MTSSPKSGAALPAPMASRRSWLRSVLTGLLKFAVAFAILGWLLHQNWEQLVEVAARPKDWRIFAFAFLLCGAAAVLTFVRWYLLVWAQDLPFRLSDAIRLGFIGYVFNFVVPGLVGGDLVKAMFLAREQRRRTVSFATVALDRLIGLLALFWVGALASIVLWSDVRARPELRQLAVWLWALSGAGLAGLGVLLTPAVYRWRWVRRTTHLPLVGRILGELFNAAATYQSKTGIVVLAGMMSLVCHGGFILSFSMVAWGLGGGWIPSIGEHFLVYPLAMFASSVVPIPAGVGVMEGTFGKLYELIRPAAITEETAMAAGVVTALSYRVVMLAVAAIGGVIYVFHRREITAVLQETPTARE